MRRLAVANHKGGSGKTTSTVNLAAALAEGGRRVLVVDLDPQAHASKWLLGDYEGPGLFEAIVDNVPVADLVRESDTAGVSVVPSNRLLRRLERSLQDEAGAEVVLRERLDELEPDAWDYVLLDAPGNGTFLILSALVAVEAVLVPLDVSFLSVDGLADFQETLDQVRRRLNPDLSLCGVLPVKVNGRTVNDTQGIAMLREMLGAHVFKTVIPESVRFREAPGLAQPITAYDPDGRGAGAYRSLAKEVVRRLGGTNGK